MHRVALLVCALLLTSCGGRGEPAYPPLSPLAEASRTCVVLSVGAHHGVAHIGALQALRDAGVRIDCVVGNSMGAIVGSLYASAPSEDPKARYEKFAKAVERRTSDATAEGIGLGALLFGGALALATGGAALPVLVGGAIGGTAGGMAGSSPTTSRLRAALDDVLGGARIEDYPLAFATQYQRKTGTGLEMVQATEGDGAAAATKSAANPYIFRDVTVPESAALDPGGDRVSATPVHDACRLFPGSHLIAINVTGDEVFVPAGFSCSLLTVDVTVADYPGAEAVTLGPRYEAAVTAGYRSTLRALQLEIQRRVVQARMDCAASTEGACARHDAAGLGDQD